MLRLLLSIFLFLLSLLVIFRAPTNFFWRVAVAVTEFPYIFIFTALLLFIFCLFGEKYKMSALIVCAVALILFTLPVIRAYMRAADLSGEFAAVFPTKENETQLKKPFSFFNMFSGIRGKEIIPENLVYKQLPGKVLTLDFYPASTNAKAPCIIVIHGGSWAGGDQKQLPALNSYLASKGYNVAAISYRLAPENKSPAPVEDTKDALDYLVKNAAQLNIDTTNFILLGRSAGGQIALVAAYSFHDPRIKGVISYYAPADMVWGATVKGNPLVLNTDKVFADYLGGSLQEVPEKYAESSAIEYVNSTSTPTLIIHGEIDAMVAFEHSVRLHKKLDEFHVKNYFLNLHCATHGCDYNLSGPSGQISTFAVERFIASVISR
ncbi:MAG: alpha/beta hydrolase [Bacteroidia bacterium]